jgi:hypothetical protein
MLGLSKGSKKKSGMNSKRFPGGRPHFNCLRHIFNQPVGLFSFFFFQVRIDMGQIGERCRQIEEGIGDRFAASIAFLYIFDVSVGPGCKSKSTLVSILTCRIRQKI